MKRFSVVWMVVLAVISFCFPFSDDAAADTASINGTVTGTNDITPLANIDVAAYMKSGPQDWAWDYVGNDLTDASGKYGLTGLLEGTYRVRFRDYDGNYVNELYDDIPGTDFYNSGTDILVPAATAVSNINASLAVASKVSGSITGPNGTDPLMNIHVELYRWTGSWWDWTSSDLTDSNGEYEAGGLVAGTYRASFRDRTYGEHAPEIYDNIPGTDVNDGGTNIIVPSESIVSNINASLALASKIGGTVTGPDGTTPLQFIDITAYQWNGSWWGWCESSSTDSSGKYEIGGLAAGTYRVEFEDRETGTYFSEAYSNAPSLDLGDDIVLPAASTVSNINASLAVPSEITGTVSGPAGVTPLQDIAANAYRRDGAWWDWSGWSSTDSSGEYAIGGLRAGTYRVVFHVGGADYLSEVYDNIPGTSFYDGGTDIIVPESSTVSNINAWLDRPARISGTVTAVMGKIPVAHSHVMAEHETLGYLYQGATDYAGTYELRGLVPGNYKMKVQADSFKDEWWDDVTHEDLATAFSVGSGGDLAMDFDLVPGQSPALVDVTSDPTGATIYLDFQPTTNTTPAIVDLGEVASRCILTGARIASHTITVQQTGQPRQAPREVWAHEAETINMHFDLTSDEAGFLSISTAPEGAEVFVDYADVPAGVSPVVVGNLRPGSHPHVILIRTNAFLRPRPVEAWVSDQTTNDIVVPLAPLSSPHYLAVDVQSVPPGADVFVDYLPTTNVTDVIVDWLDAASHSGIGWRTASHTVMLRGPGYHRTAPRYVPEETNRTHQIMMNLVADPEQQVDDDDDGLPDQWEDAYRLHDRAPGENGPDDDPDHDGATNEEELGAGTDPMDGGSVFQIPEVQAEQPGEPFSIIFNSVPGRTYVVMCAETLDGGWVQASGLIVAQSHQTGWTTMMPEGRACHFFRVIVLAP